MLILHMQSCLRILSVMFLSHNDSFCQYRCLAVLDNWCQIVSKFNYLATMYFQSVFVASALDLVCQCFNR